MLNLLCENGVVESKEWTGVSGRTFELEVAACNRYNDVLASEIDCFNILLSVEHS